MSLKIEFEESVYYVLAAIVNKTHLRSSMLLYNLEATFCNMNCSSEL